MSDEFDKAQALTDQAFEALNNGDLDEALKLGRRLEKRRYSAAFEVQALAYAEQGKIEKAITVLKKGVKKAPQVWLLWQLLGNYHSDQSEWDEAFQCYRQALACPHVDTNSVRLNQSIALGRCGQYDEALQLFAMSSGSFAGSFVLLAVHVGRASGGPVVRTHLRRRFRNAKSH